MTPRREWVNLLAGLVLAGILGYLYLKTEAPDFSRHSRILANLLTLKDIDAGWSLDLLQTRLEPAAAAKPLAPSRRLAQDTLAELLSSAGNDADREIALTLEALQRDLDTKIQLVEQFRALLPGSEDAARLSNRILLLPTGSRIDTLTALFGRRLERSSDEKELYRVYLISYSAALLVLVAWIGSRLLRSYHLLNEANRALKEANQELERRVEERTRELSDALRHLKESETMLIQTEKMSSLGQMVAGIAHEINTPLAYVKASLQSVQGELPQVRELVQESDGLLTMLSEGETDEAKLAAQFERAARAARRFQEHQAVQDLENLVGDGLHGIREISELVLSLKNFSRLDRTKVARFDLNEGVENSLVIARNVTKRKTLNKRLGDIPPVTGWPSQINQVLLNLITNAAQATPEAGGVISVTTRREGDDRVAVEVEDNGHGIPPEILPRIFDPFFTTKEVGSGTGLGLSIAYKIVEQHGGMIRVDSKPGKGTRFTVILPLEPPEAVS